MGLGLKVAHRGVLWAAFAEAPALITPPGTLGIQFDRPGVQAPNLALVIDLHDWPRELNNFSLMERFAVRENHANNFGTVRASCKSHGELLATHTHVR